MLTSSLFQGYAIGLSLIVAIGPQNMFVIQQGIKRQHIFLCAIICSLTDAALISLGTLGLGSIFQLHPILVEIARWFGASFLTIYGITSFRNAWHPTTLKTTAMKQGAISTKKVLTILLGLGLLNPHAYLDTVVLLGSIAAQHSGSAHYFFSLGAVLASCTWFFTIAYGAKLLTPLFRKEVTWRILDIIIGITMLLIAIKLIY